MAYLWHRLCSILLFTYEQKVNLKHFDARFNGGSVVEWLKRRVRDQHGLGSKPTRAILLYPWERHFTALSPAWWSWQAALNYIHISIK